ncbi:MAG TPA: SMP-30/gluconolactonase/LRE family protein [Bryobacteraceae bacterium]|jgi:gluconolactonase|nr:SMP-30/gluconolactonase/LRE family protein [Bryobacteraceae bacterium]
MRRVLASLLWAGVVFAQELPQPKIDSVAGGHQFTEGPVWVGEGYLLFSDVPANKIHKASPEGVTVFRENTGAANGNFYDDKGRLYSCEGRARRVTRLDKKGKLDVLAERFEGKRFNAPNDITVSRNGHVYFTDPSFGNQSDGREMDFYGVYQITPKGEVHLIAKPSGRPNGIALNAKGDKLFVANTDERNIRVYDVAKDGSVSNERIFVDKIEGPPDGLKVDEAGRVWLAADDVLVYSPEGKQVLRVRIPQKATNLTIADPQTVYVTAYTAVYRLHWQNPLTGKGAQSN